MANGIQESFESFVYRGRPPGSEQPASWHLTILRYADIEGQRVILGEVQMTPAQAEAAGWPLSRIVEGINAEALAERDAVTEALAALTTERDTLATQVAQADAGDAADIAALQAELREQQAIARQALEHAEGLSARVEAAEREQQEREANALQAGTEIARLQADLDTARREAVEAKTELAQARADAEQARAVAPSMTDAPTA